VVSLPKRAARARLALALAHSPAETSAGDSHAGTRIAPMPSLPLMR
jgi:hypothetical protein